MEKVISLEVCTRLKFDYFNKWYMHNLESLQENEMHKILCDIEIQTNHRIPARRPDLVLIKYKKKELVIY